MKIELSPRELQLIVYSMQEPQPKTREYIRLFKRLAERYIFGSAKEGLKDDAKNKN